jgi:hypothetical protein
MGVYWGGLLEEQRRDEVEGEGGLGTDGVDGRGGWTEVDDDEVVAVLLRGNLRYLYSCDSDGGCDGCP